MKALISLDTISSKKLIAKAVREYIKDEIEKRLIIISKGSTNSFLVEEILGRKIDKNRYIAGFIDKYGPCVTDANFRLKDIIIDRGKIIEDDLTKYITRLSKGDILIKGGNALDKDGYVGVLLASKEGGTLKYYPMLKAKGVRIIIPISLDKYIPHSLREISNQAGIEEIDESETIKLGIIPISGEVITEIEAFKILFDVNAYLMAGGGLNDRNKLFLIIGEERKVKGVIKFVNELKREEFSFNINRNCKSCPYNCRRKSSA